MANLAPHAYAEDARNPFGAGKNQGDTYVFTLPLGTANLALNSEFPLYKCAKNCWVSNPWMTFTDMDTSGSPALVFDLGITSNDDAIMAAVTATAAGTSVTAVATLVDVPAGEVILASVKTAAVTAAAGTLTVGFTVHNKA